mgnify:CR=1 FL=1
MRQRLDACVRDFGHLHLLRFSNIASSRLLCAENLLFIQFLFIENFPSEILHNLKFRSIYRLLFLFKSFPEFRSVYCSLAYSKFTVFESLVQLLRFTDRVLQQYVFKISK